MKKRNLTIIVIAVFCVLFVGAVMLLTGRKETGEAGDYMEASNSGSGVIPDAYIDYSGLGNEQGNIENPGGHQTYLANRGIVINDHCGGSMLCFDDSSAELQFFCDKRSCPHYGSECVTNQPLSYLLSYSTVVFGVPRFSNAKNEIWKCQNNEISCFYRTDDTIGGLWGYQGYLYFMKDSGVFRVLIEDPIKEERVLDKPVLIEYLTFYKDKMYFCEESAILYQADLDGGKKERFCDEKLYAPQICGDSLYYRSVEFDENGVYQMKNTLKSISLKDKKKKTVIDDEVGLFNVDTEENKIYYLELNDAANESNQSNKATDTTLNVLNLNDGKIKKIVDCARGYLYTFPQSDWIVFEKYEGELEKGEVARRPTHLYCIRKDGSEEKRLDYPDAVEE